MRASFIRAILLTALLSSAATLILVRWDVIPGSGSGESSSPAEQPARADISRLEPPFSEDEETNIRVYNQVSPGVVNITSTVVEYDFFFSPVARQGTGSGSVIDLEGHVLTNFHVIAGARNLEVALPDQSKYRAAIVGTDQQNDLAVIRLRDVPRDRLHPVKIGDSTPLKVGQKVLAIGNPFRLQNTLTIGIISSLGRTIQTDNGDLLENVIQTDAAINRGNSGGPLLNTKGEMIGINTSIISPSGGNIGIGFAVPSSTIRRVVEDLIKEGRVLRPWLGIEGYTITPDLATALNLPVSAGILVAKVYRGSSAAAADIRGAQEIAVFYNERILAGGDIVTSVHGKPVHSMHDLRGVLEELKPGETVLLVIFRGGTRLEKSVRLTERPPGVRF